MIQTRQLPLMLKTLAILILTISIANIVECDRQGDSFGFKSPCGTAEQVSGMIGKCFAPMQQIIEGKISIPKNDDDYLAVCNRFTNSSNCIRQVTKDCLSGLHKASANAISNALKRTRTAECKTPESRAQYREPIACAVKHSPEVEALFRNFTGIAQGIRDLPNISAEEKMMKICCMMDELDVGLNKIMKSDCSSSAPVILKLLHAVTDDAKNTVCRAPKCENALKKVIRSQMKQKQLLIEPIVQVLFMINVD